MDAAALREAFPPLADRTLARLRARLNRWELIHLREHCAQLASQLEDERRSRESADSAADYWREQVYAMQEDLADDMRIGMTREGQLGIVKAGA